MKIIIGKLTIEFHIRWEPSYMRQIHQALREERKLAAIKIYKDHTGKGLKESKEFIDQLQMEEIWKRSKRHKETTLRKV